MAVTPRLSQQGTTEVWEWVLTAADPEAQDVFSTKAHRVVDMNGTADSQGFNGATIVLLGDWVPDERILCEKAVLGLPDYFPIKAVGRALLSPVHMACPPFWCRPVVQGTLGPTGVRITMIGW